MSFNHALLGCEFQHRPGPGVQTGGGTSRQTCSRLRYAVLGLRDRVSSTAQIARKRSWIE